MNTEMESPKKMTSDKKILLETIKVRTNTSVSITSLFFMSSFMQEYSDHTTIHGINYVFASFLSFHDRFVILNKGNYVEEIVAICDSLNPP